MEPSRQRDLRLALAGLQAGCLGSLLMMGWWVLGEFLQRRSAWIIPNLLATTFYGERAYRSGFVVSTWSGLAFPIVLYCAAGVLFGLVARERRTGWVVGMTALAYALTVNWLIFGFALKRLNPLLQIYSPDRLITVSHLLYAAALPLYRGFARRLTPVDRDPGAERRPDPPISEALEPNIPQSDQEVGRSVT